MLLLQDIRKDSVLYTLHKAELRLMVVCERCSVQWRRLLSLFLPAVVHFRREIDDLHMNGLEFLILWRNGTETVAHLITIHRDVLPFNAVADNRLQITLEQRDNNNLLIACNIL